MLKLREPFSQKVHLHIRQNLLQRLWDMYVPADSPEYGQIDLIYLKDGYGQAGKQPEQIQLLLRLIVQNKRMQISLMQSSALVKIGQKQMENRLRQIEHYYTLQLKSYDFAMFRTVKQYVALLEQASGGSERYRRWQSSHQEIEKQREEYRQLSFFTEKLREALAESAGNTLRTMERELVSSLSETEYQAFAEAMIWQERPELITYLEQCSQAQCRELIRELEKDTRIRQALPSVISGQPVKEELLAAVRGLEQEEFGLFYHQFMAVEAVSLQTVKWERNRTEMLRSIDRLEPEASGQMWRQMEGMAQTLFLSARRQPGTVTGDMERLVQAEASVGNRERLVQVEASVGNTERLVQSGADIRKTEALRTMERELVYDLSETEYQTFTEKAVWQEKPELIAYFKACGSARCREIVRELEKNIRLSQVLPSAASAQPPKQRLLAAIQSMGQEDFHLFYHQVMDVGAVNPQTVIWEKSRTRMLRSIETLTSEGLQKVWAQIQAVTPVKAATYVFSNEMLRLQNQYRQNGIRSIQEQITEILEQNGLEKIADIVDIGQLVKSAGEGDGTPLPEEHFEEAPLWDGAYQVIRNLEQECRIRRERIVQQQVQAFESCKEAYRQLAKEEDLLPEQTETAAKLVERMFCERYPKLADGEELSRLREWSEAFLEVCSVDHQGREEEERITDSDALSVSSDRRYKLELIRVIRQMNRYMETQHVIGKRLTLDWQGTLPKDERIQKSLAYIRKLEEEPRKRFLKALSDMALIWQEVRLSEQLSFKGIADIGQLLPERAADAVLQEPQEELTVRENGYESAEDRERLRNLIGQINDRADAQLVYTDSRLYLPQVRELLKYIGQLDEEQYGELVKELAQITELQMLSHKEAKAAPAPAGEETRSLEGRQGPEAYREPCAAIGLLPEVSDQDLWEWGEALLFHPSSAERNAGSVGEEPRKVAAADDMEQKELQTQAIRSQVEMAKNRNSLQRLIRQINHQADLQLVYTDAQLRQPQVQKLLNYIRGLDETQYGVLVKELVQITKFQTPSDDGPGKSGAGTQSGRKEPAEELRARRTLQGIEALSAVEQQDSDSVSRNRTGVSYRRLWEWGEALLLHPEHITEVQANREQEEQEKLRQTTKAQAGRAQEALRQTETAADKQHLQHLIRQMDETQYGELVKELAHLTKLWQLSYDETKAAYYPVLAENIRNYERQQRSLLHRNIRQIEQKLFPQAMFREAGRKYERMPYMDGENRHESETAPYVNGSEKESGIAPHVNGSGKESGIAPYVNGDGVQMYETVPYVPYGEDIRTEYGRTPYEEDEKGYRAALYENAEQAYAQSAAYGEAERAYAQPAAYEMDRRENRYQAQELEYSMQSAQASEEQLQRQELRMQQETAKLKSAQEQLDKKIKEVEQQLQRTQVVSKEKEDVRSFAEQVKRQMYEELHVERLRRGLI